MIIRKMLLLTLFSSLLTSCGLMGDYIPSYEMAAVSKTDDGFCFPIKKSGDYYVHSLSIRDRNAPERSGFNKLHPAIKIDHSQFCIPETYYSFPDSGEVRVDIALRSPTQKMKRRDIVSEFRMVKGVPQPFTADEYTVPTYDSED
ncbi:hypothetical protein ERHA54_31290 [Erwinia rhapontici]|uniref:putative T6SS immunity periplasmic lipoprotein n=1 Tax=Erwinia rhapontici TaxID=55212 RepID=UPI00105E5508|nr:putative T6SS immunity periplasmic lipoprotein [Erwinia rhapontici]TDT02035.1 hypothetical protein EDF84_101766 [Erwinia rhapontici]BCQ40526.1 hypothetical protein ERHA54_31290 [Erwinia rhapontici]